MNNVNRETELHGVDWILDMLQGEWRDIYEMGKSEKGETAGNKELKEQLASHPLDRYYASCEEILGKLEKIWQEDIKQGWEEYTPKEQRALKKEMQNKLINYKNTFLVPTENYKSKYIINNEVEKRVACLKEKVAELRNDVSEIKVKAVPGKEDRCY